MHRFFSARRWSMMTLAIGLLLGGNAAFSQEPAKQPAEAPKLDRTGAVIVPQGSTVRLQMKNKQPIEKIESDRPNVVMAIADNTDPTRVILLGKAIGTAKVTLRSGNVEETYEVVVQADIETLRKLMKLAAPTASVDVIPFGQNRVVLTGYVAHSDDIQKILELASATVASGQGGTGAGSVINAMSFGGVQHVQLDVTVASVSRTRARQRGFSFVVGGSTFSTGSLLGGLIAPVAATSSAASAGVGVLPSPVSTANGSSGTALGNLPFGIAPANFQGILQALKTENMAKIMAESKLTTQSGKTATLLSGGQQPVIGTSSGITGPGVQYVPVGTQLTFTPIVYGNGKIYLEVAPTISQADFGLGLNFNGSVTPFITQTSLTASVVMEPGQTFALGGLLQNISNASTNRVPILGEIPFLAPFFSTQTDNNEETELIVLVTPHLVDALDCSQLPKRLPGQETRLPDDFEFFLETMLEVPRGQRTVFDGKKYKAAWKNDPTASTYPCGPNGCNAADQPGCSTANCAAGVTKVPGAANGPAPVPVPVMTTIISPGQASVNSVPGIPAIPTSLPNSTGGGGYQIERNPVMPQEPANLPSTTVPPGSLSIPLPR